MWLLSPGDPSLVRELAGHPELVHYVAIDQVNVIIGSFRTIQTHFYFAGPDLQQRSVRPIVCLGQRDGGKGDLLGRERCQNYPKKKRHGADKEAGLWRQRGN